MLHADCLQERSRIYHEGHETREGIKAYLRGLHTLFPPSPVKNHTKLLLNQVCIRTQERVNKESNCKRLVTAFKDIFLCFSVYSECSVVPVLTGVISHTTSAKDSSAASRVCCRSSSLCAAETKPASNAEGAR